jgi:hypothetical protein
MLRRKLKVARGQRFRPLAFPWLEWEVLDIFDDASSMAHARLVLVGDPHTRKTIACAQLADSRYFAFIEPGSSAAAAPAPAA